MGNSHDDNFFRKLSHHNIVWKTPEDEPLGAARTRDARRIC